MDTGVYENLNQQEQHYAQGRGPTHSLKRIQPHSLAAVYKRHLRRPQSDEDCCYRSKVLVIKFQIDYIKRSFQPVVFNCFKKSSVS